MSLVFFCQFLFVGSLFLFPHFHRPTSCFPDLIIYFTVRQIPLLIQGLYEFLIYHLYIVKYSELLQVPRVLQFLLSIHTTEPSVVQSSPDK